jgi:hypothetical protein
LCRAESNFVQDLSAHQVLAILKWPGRGAGLTGLRLWLLLVERGSVPLRILSRLWFGLVGVGSGTDLLSIGGTALGGPLLLRGSLLLGGSLLGELGLIGSLPHTGVPQAVPLPTSASDGGANYQCCQEKRAPNVRIVAHKPTSLGG